MFEGIHVCSATACVDKFINWSVVTMPERVTCALGVGGETSKDVVIETKFDLKQKPLQFTQRCVPVFLKTAHIDMHQIFHPVS